MTNQLYQRLEYSRFKPKWEIPSHTISLIFLVFADVTWLDYYHLMRAIPSIHDNWCLPSIILSFFNPIWLIYILLIPTNFATTLGHFYIIIIIRRIAVDSKIPHYLRFYNIAIFI